MTNPDANCSIFPGETGINKASSYGNTVYNSGLFFPEFNFQSVKKVS